MIEKFYFDGIYQISVRSTDDEMYSDVVEITVEVDNPEVVESDSHKWALFVAAANFPSDNESKLGNGGLYLAEEMAAYLIEECSYATSNVIILFDDGWIRDDNGKGEKIETLVNSKQSAGEHSIMFNGKDLTSGIYLYQLQTSEGTLTKRMLLTK